MRAVVLRDYGGFDRLRVEETEMPAVEDGVILIRNRAFGVNHCDTDVRRGVFGIAQKFPHVMGVDSAGEVAAVGTGVQSFAVGDRVSPHFLLSCGSCRNCIAGRENICLNAGVLGVTTWGTYAEFVKVPAHSAVRLPDNISFDDAVAASRPTSISASHAVANGICAATASSKEMFSGKRTALCAGTFTNSA